MTASSSFFIFVYRSRISECSIGYRVLRAFWGFRSIGVGGGSDDVAVAGADNKVWAIDADLDALLLAGLSVFGGNVADVVLAAKFDCNAAKCGLEPAGNSLRPEDTPARVIGKFL